MEADLHIIFPVALLVFGTAEHFLLQIFLVKPVEKLKLSGVRTFATLTENSKGPKGIKGWNYEFTDRQGKRHEGFASEAALTHAGEIKKGLQIDIVYSADKPARSMLVTQLDPQIKNLKLVVNLSLVGIFIMAIMSFFVL